MSGPSTTQSTTLNPDVIHEEHHRVHPHEHQRASDDTWPWWVITALAINGAILLTLIAIGIFVAYMHQKFKAMFEEARSDRVDEISRSAALPSKMSALSTSDYTSSACTDPSRTATLHTSREGPPGTKAPKSVPAAQSGGKSPDSDPTLRDVPEKPTNFGEQKMSCGKAPRMSGTKTGQKQPSKKVDDVALRLPSSAKKKILEERQRRMAGYKKSSESKSPPFKTMPSGSTYILDTVPSLVLQSAERTRDSEPDDNATSLSIIQPGTASVKAFENEKGKKVDWKK